MNKNPYEVRLDIMKMAQEMLDRESQIEQTVYLAKVESIRSAHALASAPQPMDINTIPTPKMYSAEDIVTRASTLYNFVNNSTTPIKKDTK